MNYEMALVQLIAYCQRVDALPWDDSVVPILADIFDCSEEEVESLLY